MSLYSPRKFSYLYDCRYSVEDLEKMYAETSDREKKRQIRRIINEKTKPLKEKSPAYILFQAHNYLLFQLKGMIGNVGIMGWRLSSMKGNSVYKRYEKEYEEVYIDIEQAIAALKRADFKLRNISALRKEDVVNDKLNRS